MCIRDRRRDKAELIARIVTNGASEIAGGGFGRSRRRRLLLRCFLLFLFCGFIVVGKLYNL